MISFSLHELVIVLGVGQGFFLAFILSRIKNKNVQANRILSYTLIFATIMLACRMIYTKYPVLLPSQWALLVDGVIFLFGPLIYHYTFSLLYRGSATRLKYIHFVPVSVHICIVLYFLTYSRSEYQQLVWSGSLVPVFSTISGTAILLNFLYLFLSFRLLYAFKHEEKQRFSFVQNPIAYLNYFLFAIFLVLALWLVNFLDRLLFQIDIPYVDYDSVWIALSLFVYVIAFYSLVQPELFRIPVTQTSKNQAGERISPDRQDYLKEAIEELMQNDNLFLNSNLTLAMLADELEESTNNISWILNNVIQKSFYDYVNQYRIKEFLNKIKNNEHHQKTILGLSHEVGFNSKSTFNRAFRSEMNCTPGSWVKKRDESDHKKTTVGK